VNRIPVSQIDVVPSNSIISGNLPVYVFCRILAPDALYWMTLWHAYSRLVRFGYSFYGENVLYKQWYV
jgi:hypothetical protein